ncbi:MAG: HAD-IA family hydrolase [Elusimicrobia bacterium]|nr:HAD-IA family hydrolase [Elusimicrobiota bacterium]
MKPRPKAVILDMDGVMVDSERQWRETEGEHIRKLVLGWSEADSHAVVGLGVVELHQRLVERHALGMSRADFLAELRGRNLPVGLASSSPRRWVDSVLERFALRPDFKALATGDETPGRTKPHPDLYLLAAARLGVEPASCLAVEDSAYGVAAAKAAGMACVGYRSGDNDAQDLSKADAEARSFAEVLAMFGSLWA